MSRQAYAQAKGAGAEHELAEVFSAAGFPAARGRLQRWLGGRRVADVVLPPALRRLFHVEAKRVERLNVHRALEQARRDAGHRVPVLAHRRNRGGWYATLPLDALLALVRHALAGGFTWPPPGTDLTLDLRPGAGEEPAP